MFGFEQIAPPRKYFGVNFETALLTIRLDRLRSRVSDHAPMTNAWSEALVDFAASRSQPYVSAA